MQELGKRKQNLLDKLATVEPKLAALRDEVHKNREAASESEKAFRKAARELTTSRIEFGELPQRIEYLSVPHGKVRNVKVPEITVRGG